MSKALAMTTTGAVLLSAIAAIAQTEIDVTASPIDKQVGPAGSQSVRYLEGAQWMTIQSQGGRAAQLDLSIQGSTFSGAGISLNGVSLQHPQTEHFNADIPLSAGILASPATLTGADQIRSSHGHLIGTLDMVPLTKDIVGSLEAGVGTEDTLFFHSVIPFGNSAVFFSHEETDNLSFDDNYLENTRGGISLNFQPNDIDVNILAAAATKDFGARGFYGVTPSWNAQEVLDDYLVSASASAGDEENSWRATALWRRTEDTYTLFWTLPGTYENSHETDITALNIDGRSALSENLALDWRASGTADSIDSTNLGDHSREYGSILAAPELSLGRLSLQAGINQIIDADEDSETFPVVAASYATDSGVELFSSYTETRRLPSYTELNYESPSSLGNSGLEPELSQNLEAGILVMPEDGTTLRATVFLHETKNTIDWTKTSADAARWLATDLGDVRTAGIQCDASRDWDAVSLYLAYIYLDREFDEDFYAGRYVINYPEHTGKVNVEYRPSASVALFLNHELRVQHDAAFREELDNTQVMADAGASIAIKAIEGARLNLVCENIWDDDFEIFPGQPPASTRYTVSLQWYWQ